MTMNEAPPFPRDHLPHRFRYWQKWVGMIWCFVVGHAWRTGVQYDFFNLQWAGTANCPRCGTWHGEELTSYGAATDE